MLKSNAVAISFPQMRFYRQFAGMHLMLKWFKTRTKIHHKADKLYGAIVTQARSRHIYASFGVPDTPEGRFEIVVLHLFLVLERLRDKPGVAQVLRRLLVEKFISDIDDSLRELGTGDLAVPKKVRRAAAGLYERVMAYRSAVTSGGVTALAHQLASYVFLSEDADWRSIALANYASEAMAALAIQDVGAITAGKIAFPDTAPHKEDVQ